MQNVTTFEGAPLERGQLVIRVEWVAYLALFVLALVLRFAELDSVPLTPDETPQALAAWRALAEGNAAPAQAASPLLFALQTLAFTILGTNEGAARVFTALAGTALVFAPLLVRGLLGRVRTFLLVALLAASPGLLLAARTSSPVIWALLFSVFALAAVWRFQSRGRTAT